MEIFIACLVSFIVAYISFRVTSIKKPDGILHLYKVQDENGDISGPYMTLQLYNEAREKLTKNGSKMCFEVQWLDDISENPQKKQTV